MVGCLARCYAPEQEFPSAGTGAAAGAFALTTGDRHGTAMLQIDNDHYQALVAHARAEYPNEACALLAGRDGVVERVYALPNAEASPTFYVVEPKAQLRAMTEMDDLDLDLAGIFHSHVATEAYPSRTDVELAAYPDAAYLILSLADQDAPVLRAFRIRDGRVDEERLTVVDASRVAG
jgi:[CysO sulfur-carrier protein]-S-L-cysteine hydrolase